MELRQVERHREAQAITDVNAHTMGCFDSPPRDVLWYLDRPELTMVERTALVDVCLGQDGKELNPAFAFCLADLRAQRLGLRATNSSSSLARSIGRVKIRESFGSARRRSVKLLDAYEALARKDADWKRLLFESPEKGWKGWMATLEANRAAFEAVQAFEAKLALGSKKALVGCGEELRRHLFQHLRSAPKPAGPEQAAHPRQQLLWWRWSERDAYFLMGTPCATSGAVRALNGQR